MKQLFLIHLGYYDEVSSGTYECHTNMFVVAEDFNDARLKIKENPIVKEKSMHVDGMLLIEAVNGCTVNLVEDSNLNGGDKITNNKFRELAPKK